MGFSPATALAAEASQDGEMTENEKGSDDHVSPHYGGLRAQDGVIALTPVFELHPLDLVCRTDWLRTTRTILRMTYGLPGEFSVCLGRRGYSSGKAHEHSHDPPRNARERMKPAEGSTVIGKSVTIKGELSGNEDLYMDGDIEGTITLPDHGLTIGPNAHVLADIRVRDVTVFGKVTGNMHATGRVDLRHSSVVNGDIFGGRLSIEENAMVKGRVELRSPSTRPFPPQTSAAKVEQESLVLEPKA